MGHPQARVTVNSRCGRACFYCRPSGEGLPTAPRAELTSDFVVAICSALRDLGIRDFKLTGGDPALWPPLVECVRRLKTEANIPKLEVISRHPSIGELASALRDAGADVVNVSIDTLKPALHRQITGIDDLKGVVEALRACVARVTPARSTPC